jgi:hypothetical protein
MSPIPLSLAALNLSLVLRPWRLLSSTAREGLLVFGAMASTTLLAMAWAMFLRRRHRHRRHKHHHEHWHDAQETEAGDQIDPEAPVRSGKRRRRRHSGRHHRPRNPTLAETGGLPPVRPEDPAEPQI